MRDGYELDIERPDIDPAAGGNHRDGNLLRVALGRVLGLEQGGAELGRVDRSSQLRPEIDYGTEMVLMGVRQHEPHQIVALLLEKADVRHDQVDSGQMLFVTEGDAEVDREPAPLL